MTGAFGADGVVSWVGTDRVELDVVGRRAPVDEREIGEALSSSLKKAMSSLSLPA